jgi:hypothetical protein
VVPIVTTRVAFLPPRDMRRRGLFGTLDQSVEFTAVQPDATTIRAVIDFDALAVGHGQVHVLAGGA